MKLHNVAQGTPEWLALRANYFTASEAPAMMGASKYQTRSDLIHQKHTGDVQAVDAAKQRIFDAGHATEAAYRPHAEELIGDELFPCTGSLEVDGLPLLASFDGLTMDRKTGFEHKLYNINIADFIDQFGEPGPAYYWQLEQQLLVSGAERILFVTSDGTKEKQEACWYSSKPERRAALIAGWAQFKQDLSAYVPPVITVAPAAKTVASLPVVFDMRVQGKLVSCNLEDYKPAALAYIEKINTKLESDQDFVDADADAKFCRDSADKLELAIEQALGQMGDINQALNTVREIAAAFDAKGLALEKLVKAEKENRRNAIVSEAAAEFVLHMKGLNERLGQPFMPAIATDFPGAVKGLKILDSMKDKVATELARAKIEANAMADRIQANMQKLVAVGDKLTFPDAATLVLKAPDDLAAVIALRVAEADRKAEELRESIRKEEADKLAAAPVQSAQPATETVAQTVTHGDVVRVMMPASVRQAMAPKPETPPTMALGEIASRLGFNVTSAFLAELGFEATTVRASKLYHEEDFVPICRALQEHIDKVVNLQNQLSAVAA